MSDKAYDPIGNRFTHQDGTQAAWYYCTNSLNEYAALSDQGETSCPFDLAHKTPSYDDDGNLVGDDGIGGAAAQTLVYDGENRLIEVRPTTLVVSCKKVTYLYDYRNRRARRQVWHCTSTANGGSWSLDDTTVYVWGGWRVLMELTGANDGRGAIGESPALTIARKYTWGLDLAGQWAGGLGTRGARGALEAAGGIGGLLAVHDVAATADYAFCYDGNGNVVQLVKWSETMWNADNVMVARYQYDPYGNVLGTPGGAYAATNRWRFSTKFFDPVTGFGDWDQRWYLPTLGRWANRDPIGEFGGAALFVFVNNDPVGRFDQTGLFLVEIAGAKNCGTWKPVSGHADAWYREGVFYVQASAPIELPQFEVVDLTKSVLEIAGVEFDATYWESILLVDRVYVKAQYYDAAVKGKYIPCKQEYRQHYNERRDCTFALCGYVWEGPEYQSGTRSDWRYGFLFVDYSNTLACSATPPGTPSPLPPVKKIRDPNIPPPPDEISGT